MKLAEREPPPVALWILASRSDAASYSQAARIAGHAAPPLSVTTNMLASGGHRTQVWAPHIAESFVWLGRTLPGFKPE